MLTPGDAIYKEIVIMLTQVINFCRDEEGATAIEYALIAALVSVAAISSLTQLGNMLNAVFSSVATKLGTVNLSLTP
jgi:pilus assembly protein Flp/PilA